MGSDPTYTIAYSSDGTQWTGITGSTNIFEVGYGINYINNVWYASGNGTSYTIASSTNGTQWTGITGSKSILSSAYYVSSLNNDILTAFGNGFSSLAISYDNGTTWTGISDGTILFDSARTVVFSYSTYSPMLIATGSGSNSIAYSLMGTYFRGIGTSNFTFGLGVVYGNGVFVAGGGTSNCLVYSYNGTNWVSANNQIFSTYCNGVTYGNGVFVAVGQGSNTLGYSTNGSSWTAVTSIFSTIGSYISYVNGIFFASGSGTNTWASSYDGINWIGRGTGITLGQVCYGKGMYLGIGGSTILYYSTNGLNWTGVVNLNDIFFTCSGIAFGNNIFVIVGDGSYNSIAYSYDGITSWVGLGKTIFSSYGSRASFINGVFYLSGTGTNSIAYGINGTQWTGLGTTAFTSGSSIASGLLFNSIPVSNNTLAYSNTLATGLSYTIYYGYFSDFPSYFLTAAPYFPTYKSGVTDNLSSLENSTNNQITTNGAVTCSIQWTGYINTPVGTSGTWTWYTNSDDASYIWIGSSTSSPTINNCVVNNGGIHTATVRSGTFVMEENTQYPILIQYGNFSSNNTLQVYFNLPNSSVTYNLNNTIFNNLISVSDNWTGLGKTIFSLQSNGIVWNGSSLYISTGQGINTLAYSSNGTQWTGLGSSTFSLSGNGVAYSSILGLFVAVGQGKNIIAYSYNGTQWTGVATTIFSQAGLSVQWSNPFFIANGIGTVNTVSFSSNGIVWTGLGTTIISNASFSSSSLLNNNTVVYSNDNMVTWSGLGSTIFSTTCNGLYYLGNIYIGLGEGTNSVAYSTNAISWTGLGTTLFTIGTGAVYNEVIYIVYSASASSIGYSYNGTQWSLLYITQILTQIRSITWSGVQFIAAGEPNINTNNSFGYSFDGTIWTGINSNIARMTKGYDISTVNSVNPYKIDTKVFFSTSSGIVVSNDGINYSMLSNPSGLVRSIAYDGVKLVGAGSLSIGALFYSLNFITWTGISISYFSDNNFVYYANNLWLTGGQYNYSGNATGIAYSFDGINWTIISNVIGAGYSAYYNSLDNLWVLGGRNPGSGGGINTLIYSTNGTQWTGLGITVFSQVCYGVTYKNSLWIAVGSGGSNTIAYSINGTQWFGLGSTVFSSSGYAVDYYNGLWISIGQGSNTIAYSSNGTQWTGLGTTIFESIGYTVKYISSLNMWIAGGTSNSGGNISYSYNGTIWFKNTSTKTISGDCNGITEVNLTSSNASLASNTLAYSSTSGTQWTGLGVTIFSYKGNGVAYNGSSIYVASGSGINTLAYSYNGTQWTGLGTTVFTSSGKGIAFGNNIFVAVGQGLNTIA